MYVDELYFSDDAFLIYRILKTAYYRLLHYVCICIQNTANPEYDKYEIQREYIRILAQKYTVMRQRVECMSNVAKQWNSTQCVFTIWHTI